MRKRQDARMPDSFLRMLEYLQGMGYKDSSISYFESRFRIIARFMEGHGYESYTYEVYASHIEAITNGREYNELRELEKRHYRTAGILYQFQQTGSFTYRRKMEEAVFRDGIKDKIEGFLASRKSLLQAEATMRHYRRDLLRFNDFLNDLGIRDVTQITNMIILQYIQQRMSYYTRPIILHTLTSIRQLFFYLYETGQTEKNLSLVVPKAGAPVTRHVPGTFSREEIEKLLGAMDRADARGKRDYAMLLIASRLGLRSSDICQLRFSELDWKQNRIMLKQKKTGAQIELPLLSEIGEAMIDYLRYGRPYSDLPYVFLKHVPPYGVVTGAAFFNAIKTGMRHAGIEHTADRKHGPHALRHSLATMLLEQNTPLPVITGILGHKNPETTKLYLSIDLPSLHKCALDVPEIVSNYYDRGRKQW